MSFRNRKKSRINIAARSAAIDYRQLEPRQMLTVDVGVNLTTTTFPGGTQFVEADTNGDIGPNHIVQVVSSEFSIRNLNGTLISAQTLQQFFGQTAGANLMVDQDAMGNPIFGQIEDARVVFDHASDRWFISSVLASQTGGALAGNQILLAVSRTDNPVDGFQSVQFVGDSSLPPMQRFNRFATLAVDGDGVLITTNNVMGANNSVSIYSIQKGDLIAATPTAMNLVRFENLNPAVVGNSIQFATDLDGTTDTSFGVGTFAGGTTISLIEIANVGTGMPVTMTQTTVTVPDYQPAAGGRQPGGVEPLRNVSPDFTGNAVSQGGWVWAVHTVAGSNSNSAVRWYQIDASTGVAVNSGTIEDPDVDYLYPSISVGTFGTIAIGFTGTGPQFGPSSLLTMGFVANGLSAVPTVTFPQNPLILAQGLDNFVNLTDGINPWGEYSATRFDPDDPFSFYTFQQFVPADDIWSVTLGEASIANIAPVISGNSGDNQVVLRRSAFNDAWAEVVFDGVVTDTFELNALDSIQLNLGLGNDRLTIDNSLGAFTTSLGLSVDGGSGFDTIDFVDAAGHRFDITGDGSGTFDLINSFVGFEQLVGSAGADVFTANNSASNWFLFGGLGNDLFDIGNSVSGAYSLSGEAGDDTYRLPLANFAMLTVIDSVGAESDTLVGLGTDGEDVILVNNELLIFNSLTIPNFDFDGIELFSFDGLGGNDTFQIQAIADATTFFGNGGDDVFNVSSNAPDNTGVLTGIQGELTIDGGSGANRLIVGGSAGVPVVVEVAADQISGFTALPINYTGSFGSVGGVQGIELAGSDFGSDIFDIRELLAGNGLLVRGNGGDDEFQARSTTGGEIVFDGGQGADVYRTTFGEGVRSVTIADSGSDDSRDRFSMRATADADTFNIANNRIALNDNTVSWNINVENVVVGTLAGNDTVTVAANQTRFIRVILNEGDDSGIVNSSFGIETLRFDGDAGADSFQFLGSASLSFVQALGGVGDDTFFIGGMSFARSRIDGQSGSDSSEVVFADRDSRRVNARDTGTDTGADTLLVLGTPMADLVDLRPLVIDREGEFITYNGNIDQLTIELIGSSDTLNLYGSSVANVDINLGIGNDTVNVLATATPNGPVDFSISLASGNDTATIFRVSESATVGIFGQSGNDSFNVGSTALTDNGNLSQIRGTLFLGGGADTPGIDTLLVNDRGAGDLAFEYTVSDTSIAHSPGNFNLERPFTSFGFSSMEFVMLSGTDGRNTFNVQPSLTTVFRLDGNLNPTPDMFFGDLINVLGNAQTQGRQVTTDGSNGFISFTDGSKTISFEEVERIASGNSGGGGPLNLVIDPENGGLLPFDRDQFIINELLTAADLMG